MSRDSRSYVAGTPAASSRSSTLVFVERRGVGTPAQETRHVQDGGDGVAVLRQVGGSGMVFERPPIRPW
jgi:hypothetical protein